MEDHYINLIWENTSGKVMSFLLVGKENKYYYSHSRGITANV